MATCSLQPYLDTAAERQLLLQYLSRTETDATLNLQRWEQRLAHWWDENPFAAVAPARGWILQSEDSIVGFQGLIPCSYWVDSSVMPAYISTTWRVDEPHRNQSLPMLMQLRRLGQHHLLMDTTPTTEVQKLLSHTGWQALGQVTRHLLLTRWFRGKWPALPAGLRFTTNLSDVTQVEAPARTAGIVQKHYTPEALAWYASSVMRSHSFAGLVDATGLLRCFVFLTPTRLKGLPALGEVDHYCATDHHLLLCLLGEVLRCKHLLSHSWLLALHSFSGDTSWDAVQSRITQQIGTNHFAYLPPNLRALEKVTVMAEGDWGL